MRRFIAPLALALALAVPTAASAAAPDGTFVWNENQNVSGNACTIGQESAQIRQNGQFVSGNTGVIDQTTTPGSRAALASVCRQN